MRSNPGPQRLATAAAVVLSLVAAACGGDDQGSESTSSTTAGPTTTSTIQEETSTAPLLAYTTDRNGEGVWLIRADGTGDVQVATDAGRPALLPDWSHDGDRIVFATRGGATEPLYVYDLETEASSQLFDCEDPCVGDDEPAYSPDDSQVAFIRYLGPFVNGTPSDCGLWIGDVAAGEVRQVVAQPDCDARPLMPRWSPDGGQITYWAERYDASDEVTGTAVFVIDPAGGEPTQLTEWELFAGEPDWSPDGTWIVIATHPLHTFACCEVSDLQRVQPDGSGLEPLTAFTDVEERATQPRYAPDGSQIVFTLASSQSRVLALMPADGGDYVRVTTSGIYTHGTMPPGG